MNPWGHVGVEVCLPEDEQILLDPEALGAEVAPRSFAQPARATGPFLRVAVQLRELHQLVVLKRVVVAGLLPHPRGVDDQGLLGEGEREEGVGKLRGCGEIEQGMGRERV